eukprot:13561377-Alexandrium_andersonii.AAC.1
MGGNRRRVHSLRTPRLRRAPTSSGEFLVKLPGAVAESSGRTPEIRRRGPGSSRERVPGRLQ